MKTTMKEVARIIGQVAKMDRHGKQIVHDYLAEDLAGGAVTRQAEASDTDRTEAKAKTEKDGAA